jgi:hypothetical protein
VICMINPIRAQMVTPVDRHAVGNRAGEIGAIIIHPTPGAFFELPIAGPLPETLDFIP